MDFGNFGVVNFTKQAKSVAFVDYLAEGKLMGTVCKKCGKKYFPPRMDCGQCLDSEVEWFEINSKGKLITHSTVNFGPSGFEEVQPYQSVPGNQYRLYQNQSHQMPVQLQNGLPRCQ